MSQLLTGPSALFPSAFVSLRHGEEKISTSARLIQTSVFCKSNAVVSIKKARLPKEPDTFNKMIFYPSPSETTITFCKVSWLILHPLPAFPCSCTVAFGVRPYFSSGGCAKIASSAKGLFNCSNNIRERQICQSVFIFFSAGSFFSHIPLSCS